MWLSYMQNDRKDRLDNTKTIFIWDQIDPRVNGVSVLAQTAKYGRRSTV